MNKPVYYKYMFIIGAAHNFLAGFVFLVAHEQLFSLIEIEPLANPVILQLLMALIIVFGVGYFWVGLDISQNRGIVKMGVLGKGAVIVLLMGHYFMGNIPILMAACCWGDIIFACLFIEFLLNSPETREAAC